MSEIPNPDQEQIAKEAERLRHRHAYHSESLESAQSTYARAQALREDIAQSNDPENEFSYHERVFANGEIAQRQMVDHSKLHHNANMWEAAQHYRQNSDTYFDLAQQDAEAAGIELRLDAHEAASSSIEHPPGYERQYTGVCGVIDPADVIAMLNEMKESRADPHRRLMVGVMTHPAVINPDAPYPDVVRAEIQAEFPPASDLDRGFIKNDNVMNTIHYADLYGPNGPRKPGEAPDVLKNLERCVELGGSNLDAIQLDLVWPDPDAIKEFRKRHPNIEIVLQIGKFALGEEGIDEDMVVERLSMYGKSVDHVLLDLSMGKGREMTAEDVAKLKRIMRIIQDNMPDIGLAVAGGLGAGDGENEANNSVYSVSVLKEIAKDFPGISIDAEGGLKPHDAQRDSKGHFLATTMADPAKSENYIVLASEILDGPLQMIGLPQEEQSPAEEQLLPNEQRPPHQTIS